VFKTLSLFQRTTIFLFSLFMGLSAHAELPRDVFCGTVASAAFAGAQARAAGMPAKDFHEAVAGIQAELKASKQYTSRELDAFDKAVKLGFKNGASNPDGFAQKVHQECITRKVT
jgi:hypothetical protein